MDVGRVRAPAGIDGPRYAWLPFSERISDAVTPQDCERVLRAASSLLARYGWTQKEGARNAKGDRAHPHSQEAALFSLNGAVMRATVDLGLSSFHSCACLALIEELTGGFSSLAFNELRDQTRSQIENLFYRALYRVSSFNSEAA